jgi:hypothetical protein
MKAVAYFSNGLGNFVIMMPSLQSVASMTDSGKIDVVLNGDWNDRRKPPVKDILKHWPVVDKIIDWPGNQFDPKVYELWFYSPHGSNGPIVPTFQDHLKIPVPRPSWNQSKIHEADHYMEVARTVGYKGRIPTVTFPVGDAPALNLPRPIFGLCNGFFKTQQKEWDKKRWPYFSQLSEILKRFFGASIVGIGSSGELDGVSMDEDFTGKLSIIETAKVISQVEVLVTSDTANMHIADLLGIPMVALFGPTLTSKNRPRSKRAIVLRSGVLCAPCQDTARFMNCMSNKCMHSITVGDVMAAGRILLNSFLKGNHHV